MILVLLSVAFGATQLEVCSIRGDDTAPCNNICTLVQAKWVCDLAGAGGQGAGATFIYGDDPADVNCDGKVCAYGTDGGGQDFFCSIASDAANNVLDVVEISGTPFDDSICLIDLDAVLRGEKPAQMRPDETAYGLSVELRAFEGDDLLVGSDSSASLYGETLEGGDGDDSIIGLGGDDGLVGQDGADLIWGGAGSDTILGGNGADTLFGNIDGSCSSGLFAECSTDLDLICGGQGRDKLTSGEVGGVMVGGSAPDSMTGVPTANSWCDTTPADTAVDCTLWAGSPSVPLNAAICPW